MKIDLNADLGESFGQWTMGNDAQMLKIVSSANVACGFHAGDPEIMRQTAETAKKEGVTLGAHPGYQDLTGFGRRRIPGLSGRDIENLVAYQIGAFQAISAMTGQKVRYVKAHGALGNASNDDDAVALAVARGIKGVDPALIMMVMPGLPTERAAEKTGLQGAREIFADRTYADSFNLTPRSVPGSLIHDPKMASERVLEMITDKVITSTSGKKLRVEIDSVCVHGDNPAAVQMAQTLRNLLESENWTIKAFADA